MGKAWEAFKNLAGDEKIVIEVGGNGIPSWAWYLLALLLVCLYVAYNFLTGYKQGKRGCELFIHTLASLFIAIGKLMARGSAHTRSHDHTASTTGGSGSTML